MTKLAFVAMLTLGAAAAVDGVAGRWQMTVDTGPAHGLQTMGLALQQEGKQVNGTLQTPHGEYAVEGRFDGGALRLKTAEGEELRITITATLQKDGTLAGVLSTSHDDMKFTAAPAKDKS